MITDGAGTPALGILIRNQSLFSIRISAVGFNIDGEVIQLEDVCYPLKLKRNPDQYSNRPNIPDDSDPNEIKSGTYLILKTYGQSSLNLIKRALLAASTKHNISMEDLVLSNKAVALVALESGRQFDSLSLKKRLWKSVSEPLVTRGKKSWSRLRQFITPKESASNPH
jgi:hypothetical protein